MTASIKLDLVIDEDFLVADVLSTQNLSPPAINALQRKSLAFDIWLSKFLLNHSTHPISVFSSSQTVKTKELFEPLKKTAEYHRVLEETQAYREKVEQEWNTNLGNSLEFMKDITDLPLDKKYTVLITHPDSKNGIYLGERRIVWGCPPEFKNYNAVYLWHEILHDDENLGRDGDISHAIIELLDNSLRINLNGGNLELRGHDHLDDIRKKIFDNDWRGYLTSPKKDILKFKQEMEIKYQK